MDKIDPKQIRYIKLGAGGRWEKTCLERGELHFGYADVPHDLCQSGDWAAITQHLIDQGRSSAKANDAVREIRDFYTLGSDCLWITFARDRLWWAFAEPDVFWRGTDGNDRGPRLRKTINGWRDTDVLGASLRMDRLSSKLTQTAAYRQTLCRIKAEDYLLRCLNAAEDPMVVRARSTLAELELIAAEMIQALHWSDFEVLVDLVFTRSGWQRVSRVGGNQKDVDIILEQPATGERAFVQVKSTATQAEFDDYVERFENAGTYDRMFFVCHSLADVKHEANGSRIRIWEQQLLSAIVVKVGLLDWLIEKSA